MNRWLSAAAFAAALLTIVAPASAKDWSRGLDDDRPATEGRHAGTEVAMGMRKEEPELKVIFDKAIREATEDGTIRALSSKWSKLDLAALPPPQ